MGDDDVACASPEEQALFSVRHISSVPAEPATLASAEYDDKFQIAARHLEQFVNDQGHAVLAVRCGSKLVSDYGTSLLTLLFPELFPFARGGWDEPQRRHPMSLQSFVQRLLRLSSGRFQCASFVLKAYNIIARQEAARSAFLRVQLRDVSFRGLTTSELGALMQYQQDCSQASRSHNPLPAAPEGLSSTAQRFSRTLEACAGAMPHTDQYAKRIGRVRVFSMWFRFGPPTLMLTLNPNDLESLALLHYAGEAPANAYGSNCAALPPALRHSALANSPGAAALAFHRTVTLFIKYVIGYDVERHTAHADGGFFGLPIAFFGAVEEQNRGSLHLHILVWISGAMPLCLRTMQQAGAHPRAPVQFDFEQLREQMCSYVSSIMSAQFQCPEEFHVCPRCTSTACPAAEAPNSGVRHAAQCAKSSMINASGPIMSDQVAPAAASAETHFGQVKDVAKFLRPLQAGGRKQNINPAICLCLRSKSSSGDTSSVAFSVQSVTVASVTRAREILGMPHVDFALKDSYNQLAWAEPTPIALPPSEDDPVGGAAHQRYQRYLVELATTQLACMSHDPAHRPTCTKKGQQECRFHFPQKPSTAAENEAGPVIFHWAKDVDGADDRSMPPTSCDVVLPRDGLSAYTVQCNLGVSAVFRCNNDVKFVHSAGIAFYVTLYHVKTHDEEAAHAREVFAAVERTHKRHMDSDPSLTAQSPLVNEHTSSLQLTLRAVRADTNSVPVGAMMAAYLALGHERYPCSEEFGHIILGTAESMHD